MTPLRLLWAGPWHAGSAVAQLGAGVVAGLATSGHRVEVARTETGPAAGRPPLPAPGPVHDARVMGPELEGGGYDAVIANLLDDAGLSGWTPWIMARAPALLLLHQPAVPNAPFAALAAGCAAVDLPMPGLRALLDGAVGVLARDAGTAHALSDACCGPVGVMPWRGVLPDAVPASAHAGTTVATIAGPGDAAMVAQLDRALAVLVARHPGLRRVASPDDADILCRLTQTGFDAGWDEMAALLATGRPMIAVADPAIPPGSLRQCDPQALAVHALAQLTAILADLPAETESARRIAVGLRAMPDPTACATLLLATLSRIIPDQARILATATIRRSLAWAGLPHDPVAVTQAARGMAAAMPSGD